MPDPLAATPLPQDLTSSEEPFDFLYAVGGLNAGGDEFHIVRIDPTGKCEYRFPRWDSAKRTNAQMRTSFELGKDGTIVHVKCHFLGRTKEVFCNNHFPTPILNIHDEVMENLLKQRTEGDSQRGTDARL